MSLHSNIDTGSNHVIHQWEYADAAARTGATGFSTSDIGKVCKQLDTEAYYVLKDATPTWYPISPSAISGDVTITAPGVATVTDLTITGEKKGSLVKFNSVNWVVFNATTGQQLIASTTTGTDWELISKGTSGQFLTMSSANQIGWATVSAGGGGIQGITFNIMGNVYTDEVIQMCELSKDCTVSTVVAMIRTAPTGSSVKVHILYSSAAQTTMASTDTIFQTSANCCIITDGDYRASSGAADTTSLKAQGILGLQIKQVGSTIAGADLTVTVIMT